MKSKVTFLLLFLSLIISKRPEDYKSYVSNLMLNLEENSIITEDRYVNNIWRLTSKDPLKGNGKSIILQHGLLDGGFSWLVLGKDSLPKKLCEEGYIVYLPYIRGTQFSRSHLDYSSSLRSDYWNFSFDEMAEYDLPAIIKFVKQRDKIEKVYYIGHSQGNFIFFLAYMNNPQFLENNIKKFIALGTIPNINNSTHILIKFFQKTKILNFMLFKNFLTFPKNIGQIFVPFCTSKLQFLCDSILSFSFSGSKDTGRVNYNRLGKSIYLYEPGGTSIQNMKHWIQIYNSKKLQKYDYGSKIKNKEHYGTENPPLYDLTKFENYSIPSLMTISDKDPFSNYKDVLNFIENIGNKSVANILRLSNYNHIDYFWADSAIYEVFPKIIYFLID